MPTVPLPAPAKAQDSPPGPQSALFVPRRSVPQSGLLGRAARAQAGLRLGVAAGSLLAPKLTSRLLGFAKQDVLVMLWLAKRTPRLRKPAVLILPAAIGSVAANVMALRTVEVPA